MWLCVIMPPSFIDMLFSTWVDNNIIVFRDLTSLMSISFQIMSLLSIIADIVDNVHNFLDCISRFSCLV